MRGVLRSIFLIAAFTLVGSSLVAQPNAEIYWDDFDRADTVMDFGVTLEGSPVTLFFTVVNNDPRDLAILLPNASADPYYLIVNTDAVPPEDPRKEEFQPSTPIPYAIATGQTAQFGVVYRALANNPLFPPDVVTEALLQLRVVARSDSLGPSIDKQFLLRAVKTKNILSSTTPTLRFDSVYVFPQPRAPEVLYRVENVTTLTIPIVGQHLEMKTSIVGTPEMEVDTLVNAEIAPKGNLEWTARYRPRDMGRDSAHFLVEYKPNQGADPDTLVTKMSGIGVEQRLNVFSATGSPQAVTVRSDTIDFGDVDADGTGGVTATIILKNEGNTNIRLLSEKKVGILERDTAAYIIEKRLRSGGDDIRTSSFDTLVVRFDPVNGGRHRIRYVIDTDLLSRSITGIPDGAQTHVLYLEAFARKPQLQITPASIDFGDVVLLPECSSASIREITVRNLGNIPLAIDSVLISPENGSLTVEANFPFLIEIAEDTVIRVRYEPQQLESLNAEVVFYTNAFGVPVGVPVTGRSIVPDTISVSIPTTIASRPGSSIAVPILADADRVPLTQTSSITVTFDPSLMRYSGHIKSGTASEGATVELDSENPRGSVTIDLRANGSFKERDTFIVLTFDTYLGNSPLTELALSPETTLFGNAGCASVLDVTVSSGRYNIDSVCGLSYLTSSSQTFVADASVFPNPASHDVRVAVSAGRGIAMDIFVRDAVGRAVTTPIHHVAEGGITLVPLSLDGALPGAYFVVVITDKQRLSIPLMVTR